MRGFIDKKRIFPIDKPSFCDIFDSRMTMFGVSRGKVEFGNILGFKQTEEQVLDCQKIEPGKYNLAHGFVQMDVEIGPDDSVSVATDSIVSARRISDIKFCGSILALPTLLKANELLKVTPKMEEAVLVVGPDVNGVTFSLERYRSESVAPLTVTTLEHVLKPLEESKVNKVIGPSAGAGIE